MVSLLYYIVKKDSGSNCSNGCHCQGNLEGDVVSEFGIELFPVIQKNVVAISLQQERKARIVFDSIRQ